MHLHERHIVTVYGAKPPYDANRAYYDNISKTAMQFSNTQRVALVFATRLRENNSALMDIILPQKDLAEQLAQQIRDLKKYEKVEVHTDRVDLDDLVQKN